MNHHGGRTVGNDIGTQPRQQGTNTWGQAITGNPAAFYRVTATN